MIYYMACLKFSKIKTTNHKLNIFNIYQFIALHWTKHKKPLKGRNKKWEKEAVVTDMSKHDGLFVCSEEWRMKKEIWWCHCNSHIHHISLTHFYTKSGKLIHAWIAKEFPERVSERFLEIWSIYLDLFCAVECFSCGLETKIIWSNFNHRIGNKVEIFSYWIIDVTFCRYFIECKKKNNKKYFKKRQGGRVFCK